MNQTNTIPFPSDLPQDPAERSAAISAYKAACLAKWKADPTWARRIDGVAAGLLAYVEWRTIQRENRRPRRKLMPLMMDVEDDEIAIDLDEGGDDEPARTVASTESTRFYKPRKMKGGLQQIPPWADDVMAFIRERGKASCREVTAHIGLSNTNINRGINIMIDHGMLIDAGYGEPFLTAVGIMHQGPKLYAVADMAVMEGGAR